MKCTGESALRVLASIDPGRAYRPRGSRQAQAEAESILARAAAETADTGRSMSRPLRSMGPAAWRFPVMAGVVVLVAAVFAGSLLVPGRPELRMTPALLTYTVDGSPDSAVSRLRALAETAENAEPLPGAGPYDHLVVEGWYLNSEISGGQTRSEIIPQRNETWWAEDDSGRILRTEPGADAYDARFARGEFIDEFDGRPPTSVAELEAWLTDGPATSRSRFDAIGDLLGCRALTPVERATVLRVLADTPGIYYSGTTVDRAGRPGLAFSIDIADGLPARLTYVVDESSGQILDYEEVLTVTPGRLEVAIPAVIAYEVFLVAERTRSSG
jgi:hypothetical protein